jgi:hypothetical protein
MSAPSTSSESAHSRCRSCTTPTGAIPPPDSLGTPASTDQPRSSSRLPQPPRGRPIATGPPRPPAAAVRTRAVANRNDGPGCTNPRRSDESVRQGLGTGESRNPRGSIARPKTRTVSTLFSVPQRRAARRLPARGSDSVAASHLRSRLTGFELPVCSLRSKRPFSKATSCTAVIARS